MASDPPPPKGRRVVRIGKYEVIAHIATGGMGAVYRARDTEEGKEVALKVLNPGQAAKPAMVERFRREARSAAKLEHENIVALYEFDEHQGTCYLVMEFVDGIDLHEHVKRNGPLDPEEARRLILQGARALRHANDEGIVHRDVKPSNFLLTRKNGKPLVKLTDFGLAREADNDEFRVTRAGTTVGTLDYIAPEQARDSGLADIRSDLYSLGCTWYHLLAGKAPFPEGGLAERLYKIMNDDPPDVRDLNERVSEETWTILSRLLAKPPQDRYQEPSELIEALLTLEGKATARPRPAKMGGGPRAQKKARRSGPAADTDAERPATVSSRRRRSRLWLGLGVGAVLLLLGGIGLGLGLSRRDRPRDKTDDQARGAPVELPRPAVPVVKAPEKKKEEKKAPPKVEVVAKVRWPSLFKGRERIAADALRKEIEGPWASTPAPGKEPIVLAVGRTAGSLPQPGYVSLAAACAAAPADRPVVIELHDNGPLFDVATGVAGRDLTLRAAKGYRPLLVWDVQRTLEERKRPRKGEKPIDAPLTFLSVRQGHLTLQGIDVALRWPEAVAKPATLVEVFEGELTVRDCTFSVAGKNPDGVTVARFGGERGKDNGGLCRFTRCQVRGNSLTALDLDAPGAEVLFEDCLLVGGDAPLLKVRADDKRGAGLKVVRSTLVCGRNLLELTASPKGKRPIFRWMGWDAILSRWGVSAGGEMLSVREEADMHGITWQAHNCIYAGWQELLTGTKKIGGEALREWQLHWNYLAGDAVASGPWPQQELNRVAALSTELFQPAGPVGFASSASDEQTLGCVLAGLPARDGWLAVISEALPVPADALADATAPEIPAAGDGLYHGERLDLAEMDLGAYLQQVEKAQKFGPRVVLHLRGKGEKTTSPIRIKGSSLVLYFEPPARGEAALALKLGMPMGAEAMIEVEGGGLDVIGGEVRVPDLPAGAIAGLRVPYLLKVRGGDLRLYRCKLEGPRYQLPTNYRGLIHLEGSGATTADKSRSCAIVESVLVSGRDGVALEGMGIRLLVRQSLIVAGSTALGVAPGASCKDRANVSCVLENVTFAAHTAVLRLGDAPEAGTPRDPAIVQARDCAFLNPFPGRKNKACLLVYEGDALARGLLVWQSERDTYDGRLHFHPEPAEPVGRALPDKIEKATSWAQLWGSQGVRETRLEPPLLRSFAARRWDLALLILPSGRGADLNQLGIKRVVRP